MSEQARTTPLRAQYDRLYGDADPAKDHPSYRHWLEQKVINLELEVEAFDIPGLKSWAQAVVDEWKRGERDYSTTKMAEKILAGIAVAEAQP